MNETLVPDALRVAQEYKRILESPENAIHFLREHSGFDFEEFTKMGFRRGKDGFWEQIPLSSNATEKQKVDHLANSRLAHNMLVTLMSSLSDTWQSPEIADNIMQKAGFPAYMYSNEPDRRQADPWNAPGISVTGTGDDDGGAGGNYSGTGKLSSAAPKQVIVNITNLLSIETVELLKSSAGNQQEILNLKEQMAQALIDVVHDFDASWHGA